MTRREIDAKRSTLSPLAQRQLTRDHHGWTFQLPRRDDPWWDQEASIRTPGFGKGVAESYYREAEKWLS